MAGSRKTTPEQREALLRIEVTRAQTIAARAELDAAIKAASDAGCSLRSIEEVARMSHERVRQIILSQQ